MDGYALFPPAVLWEQHYEHRVVVPEIVFAFDWLFLQGRAILPLVLTAAFDLSVWGILFLACRRSTSGINKGLRCGLLLSAIFMAWPGVAFVLAFPFSLQFILCQCALAASFLTFAARRTGWTIALGIVASFSSANGLIVWPILLSFGIVTKRGRSFYLAVALAAVLVVGLFFTGYKNIGNFHPGVILTKPAFFLGYFLMYIGMPFGAATPVEGLGAGGCSLLILAAILVTVIQRRVFDSPLFIVCFGICLATLATAFVTTSGRLPLDGRIFTQAIVTPGRYVNFSAHYWAALILLATWTLNQTRKEAAFRGILVLATVSAFSLSRTGEWIKTWMGFYAEYQYAATAIEAGLTTPEMGAILNYADGSLPIRSLEKLRQRHVSLYSWDRYLLIGRDLTSLNSRLGSELPRRQILAVQPIAGGTRITGWANTNAYVLVVDLSGRVVGLGRHLPAAVTSGVPVPFPAEDAHNYWVAFTTSGFEIGQARFFILKE